MHKDFTSIKDAVEYFTHLQDKPFTTNDIELKVSEEGIVTTNSGYIASLIKANGFVFDKSLKKWFPKIKTSNNTYYRSSRDTEQQLQFAKAKIERLEKDLHAAKEKIVILERDYMTVSTLEAAAQKDLAKYKHFTHDTIDKIRNTIEKMNAEMVTDIIHDAHCSKCIKRFFCKKYNDSIFPKIFKPCPEHRELVKHINKINEVFDK